MSTFENDLRLGRRVPVIGSDDFAKGSITEDKIADGAVTTAKIADGAVTAEKIPDEVITNAMIADGALTEEKFAPGTIDALQKMDFTIEEDGHLWIGKDATDSEVSGDTSSSSTSGAISGAGTIQNGTGTITPMS